MLDDTMLDDDARLVTADRHGALRAVATAGAQVRSVWLAADEAGIAALADVRPRALVLLGRPGTATAALRVVESLLVATCPVPVVVAATAPPWLGPLDVVVAVHRGREADPAEEALAESVHRATRRGAQVVLAGPAEGPVAAAGAGRGYLVVPRLFFAGGAHGGDVDDGAAAPTDTATVLAVALRVVVALGLLPVDGERLADALDAEAERDGPRGEAFLNPAKSQALRLAEHTPLLWGADPVAGAVAGYAAAALAAHAGVVAHADTLDGAAAAPALQARLTARAGADAIFADPFDDPGPGGEPPRLVVVAVREDVPTRRRVAQLAARSPAPDVVELDADELTGDTPASEVLRAAVLVARWDFAAVYLGLAIGAAPEPTRTG